MRLPSLFLNIYALPFIYSFIHSFIHSFVRINHVTVKTVFGSSVVIVFTAFIITIV